MPDSKHVLRFERDSGTDSWVGVVTVVECLADCAAGGFTLLGVEVLTAPSGDSSGTDTSATAWSDIDQILLMGGFNVLICIAAIIVDARERANESATKADLLASTSVAQEDGSR